MENNEKECPYCAEIIKAKAIKCKHCGEFLNPETLIVSSPIGPNVEEAQLSDHVAPLPSGQCTLVSALQELPEDSSPADKGGPQKTSNSVDTGPIDYGTGCTIIVLATTCIVWYSVTTFKPSPAPPPSVSSVATRKDSSHTYTVNQSTVIGRTKEALSLSHDPDRRQALVNNGLIFVVGPGVEISVTDRSFATCEVLVLTGSQAGKQGYLPAEFVPIR